MARTTSPYDLGVNDGFMVQVGDQNSYAGASDPKLAADPNYRRGLSDGRAAAIDEELIALYLKDHGGDRKISTGEAAKFLGCSIPTVIKRIDDGYLTADKTGGGNRRLTLSEVLRHSSSFHRHPNSASHTRG